MERGKDGEDQKIKQYSSSLGSNVSKEKPRNKTSEGLSKEELEKIQKMYEESKEKQLLYDEYCESIKNLEPLEKAESWLHYIAENIRGYIDQEALVYFVSRGKCSNYTKQIHDLEVWWREELNNTQRSDPKSNYFWSSPIEHSLVIDSVMMRTKEWLKINGFEKSWSDLVKKTDYITPEEPSASYLLMNYCRSDYALTKMRGFLGNILKLIVNNQSDNENKWQLSRPKDGTFIYIEHNSLTANLVFSFERLHPKDIDEIIINEAIQKLIYNQDDSGGWKAWQDGTKFSIETTAMAIHALALNKPDGWERYAKKGMEFLLSKQHECGFWQEFYDDLEVYTTVLVLDAIELAKGGTNVTFRLPVLTNELSKKTALELIELAKESCENNFLELKYSFQHNKQNGNSSEDSKEKVLVAVNSFMNTDGGVILLGVENNYEVCGVNKDMEHFESREKLKSAINNYLFSKLKPPLYTKDIRITFEEVEDKIVCKVTVPKAEKPIFIKDNEEFYIRADGTSRKLPPIEMLEYVRDHFKQ